MINGNDKFLQKKAVCWLASLLILFVLLPLTVLAEESDTRTYYDSKYAYKTRHDSGYSDHKDIDSKDPHYGWSLGRFSVSGYTRATSDENGNYVFLKNVGDTISLDFELQQDVNKLNGNDKLIISEDKNGYDKYFGIEKTNFGRGTLIVRKTDYQNATGDPVIYKDFLVAKASLGANTNIGLYEEGDYEVALDYEIQSKNWGIIPDNYSNYRISFKFSVRNGNCMVYPFDAVTKAELTNKAITENGFYLDLAKSRYLDIDIKKEVMTESADGLEEDTRFNRPAKDGEKYTDEGIYTITVKNRYTAQETIKKIYVGTNSTLKAAVATGLSIKEINQELSQGGHIEDDGVLVKAQSNTTAMSGAVFNKININSLLRNKTVWLIAGIAAILIILLICIAIRKRRKKKKSFQDVRESEDNTREDND